MDGFNELAKILKERENPNIMGIQVGTVVSVTPLKIVIGDKIILDTDNLVVTEGAYYDYVLGAETVQRKIKLTKNDKVILIPSNNEQTYFLIDKVVTL